MKPRSLLLADDHDIVLAGLRQLLEQPGFEVVGTVSDGHSLVKAAAELRPDMIVTDVTMPLLNGIDAARQIRKVDPGVRIIFLTMHADIGYATEALRLGCAGYVLKSAVVDKLPLAVDELLHGGVYIARAIRDGVTRALQALVDTGGAMPRALTARQREVLQMLAEGQTTKEVARRLNVSPKTVEFHKSCIREQTGLQSLAELARYAARSGLVA